MPTKLAALLAALSLAAPDVLAVKRPEGPEWFGLYLLGKKAGWTRLEVTREKRDGKDVLVARSETLLSATVGTKAVQRSEKDEKVYEAKKGGRLLSFRAEKAGDGGNRLAEGTCTPRGCTVKLKGEDGTTQTRDLGPSGDTAEQADPDRLAVALKATVRGPQLDLEQLREKKMKAEYKGRGKLAGGGVVTEVSIVAESEEDDRMPAQVSITDDGRIVEIRFGNSLVAKPEAEATAKQLDKVDLFGLARVKLPHALPQDVPGVIEYRVKGLPKEFQAADPRQSYAPGPDGDTLMTITVKQPAAADRAKDTARPVAAHGEMKEFLVPTPEIDSDYPEIQKLSKKVVGKEKGVYAASVEIAKFVKGYIRSEYGASHDKASDVLHSKKGDCTEHAVLFAALARAAGIPTREVHGLVYTETGDGVPALYWHAWDEVYSGGEWIAVDPTFGQAVADATHVTLGRGTQVDTVSLLGALAVVSAEAKKAP